MMQRRKFGAWLKTARAKVPHSAVNSIRYATTVLGQLSVEERDSEKGKSSPAAPYVEYGHGEGKTSLKFLMVS